MPEHDQNEEENDNIGNTANEESDESEDDLPPFLAFYPSEAAVQAASAFAGTLEQINKRLQSTRAMQALEAQQRQNLPLFALVGQFVQHGQNDLIRYVQQIAAYLLERLEEHSTEVDEELIERVTRLLEVTKQTVAALIDAKAALVKYNNPDDTATLDAIDLARSDLAVSRENLEVYLLEAAEEEEPFAAGSVVGLASRKNEDDANPLDIDE